MVISYGAEFMTKILSSSDLDNITATTLNHYETSAAIFWEGTRDHDVSQNYSALLEALPARKGLKILDFGCGPGRDLAFFKSLGHLPTGLDGSKNFCDMAAAYSGCPVLQQNFLNLELPVASFDGVFANATMFHIPGQELGRILGELREALVPQGILFTSNPRGEAEGWSGERYGTYFEFESYQKILENAGFEVLNHYFRPTGLPRAQQPWLAVVSKSRLN